MTPKIVYRIRWFIGDLKFKYTILWLLKKGWFTKQEIGKSRIDMASRSIWEIWKRYK